MVGSYIQFVRNLILLGVRKRGRPPVFNSNQFFPWAIERQLVEMTQKEFLSALENNIQVALQGENFADSLEDLMKNPSSMGKDFVNRLRNVSNAVSAKVSADFAKQSEMTVGQPYYPPAAKEQLFRTWEQNFINLCVSAEEDAKKEISRIVAEGKMKGWNKNQVEKMIREKLPAETKHRAELIARTELGKLNSAARIAQFKELGIKYYRWMTTIDGRERHSHAMMNKQICSVDNPGVIYEETENGLVEKPRTSEMYIGNPGEDFQCRCSMISWDPEIDGKYQLKGETAEEIRKKQAEEEEARRKAAEEAARLEQERKEQEEAERVARAAAERKLEILRKANERHASRSNVAENKIRNEMTERIQTRSQARAILNELKDIPDVDSAPMLEALKTASTTKIKKQTQKLQAIKTDIESFSRLENPLEVAKQYGVEEARKVDKAVESKLNSLPKDLDDRKSKLEFEIQWVEDHKKYATWKVAQDAYKKALKQVEYQIKWKAPDARATAIEAMFAGSKSKVAADAIAKIKAARAAEDLPAMEKAMKEAEAVYKKLHAKKLAKGKVQSGVLINGSTPRTLEQLPDCIEDYKKNNYHFDKNLYAYEDDIKQAMLNFFDKTDYGMDIYCNLLESVFKKGFLNTFQTGTSNGYNGSRKTTGPIESTHSRLNASHLFFMSEASGMKGSLSRGSYTGSQLERKQYEKYGHVIDKDKVEAFNVITHYGNCQVRFKKKNVNCTWTWDDSLCLSYQPSLTTDPSSVSMDKEFRDIDKRPKSSEVFTTVNEFQRKHGYTSYVELQYHGEVKVEDVESITFKQKPRDYAPKDKYDEWISKDLANQFVARGVEIWYVENGVAKKYIPQP